MFSEGMDRSRAKVRDETNVEDCAPVGQLTHERSVVDRTDAMTDPVGPKIVQSAANGGDRPHLASMWS